jgi:UDP-glucose 4-epimerase
MDILLTGATGFIGSHLRRAFTSEHKLFALTRHNPMPDEGELIWLTGDLSRTEISCLLPTKMDAIVYLAQSGAYRQFPERAEDIFKVNVLGAMTLLNYARRAGTHTFIFASSANVYRQSDQRISEEFVVEPRSFYAKTKRMAEMLIESYSEFFNCIVLRLFTVYGPGQKEMLIPNLVERVRKGQLLQVQGRQGLKVSPVYVDDVNYIIQKFLEHERFSRGFEIFNIGGDELLGIHELGLIIGKTFGVTPHFDFLPGDEPLGWIADNSKLKARLKWDSFTPFADGIRQMVRSNWRI